MRSQGTYAGLIEKLPHILKMGFNAIELLPIQEFNEAGANPRCYPPTHPPDTTQRLNATDIR